ncbi:MAG: hypothetical protein FK733_16220 [Asgard group archaeon]|nr:hypothetical protein [Asgard group archaeon]
MTNKIAREKLIQDVRQLTNILEQAHPDPYINGGGKVAYHRRLQELILSIPEKGMTKEEFFFHINPFIAKLEDAHTGLYFDKELQDKENPGGVPLYFIPIENSLVVSAVTREDDYPLLGAKLISIEGILFDKIINRTKNLQGFDNMSNLLGNLGRFGMLYFKNSLLKLIPEWKDNEQITVTLKLSNGKIEKKQLLVVGKRPDSLLTGKTKLELPNPIKCFDYNFLDEENNIAYLKIDNMMTYREAHELFQSIGYTEFNTIPKKIYPRYNDGPVPDELSDQIKGLPSATELFTSLFQEMKKNKTDYLLVDLRKCDGGQDYIILFLLYYIVGFEKAVNLIKSRSDVLKFSQFMSDQIKDGINLEEIHYYKHVPLEINDYHFGNDKTFTLYQETSSQIDDFSKSMEKMPSFYNEFKDKKHEACYTPKKIIVLSTDVTHSSGFDLMLNLKRIGAVTLGVASGQSGNCFGNVRMFELKESTIKGKVATRFFIAFPENPNTHLTLEPDFELTYDLFSSFNFDENAIIIYALDLIKKKKV